MALNDRVRHFLQEERRRKRITTTDLAEMMGWSQSKVTQKLTGRSMITLDELEAFCTVLSVSPVEAVRDRGLEFLADMTPTELRILELLRRLPATARNGFHDFLRVHSGEGRPVEKRGLTKERPIFGKPRLKD